MKPSHILQAEDTLGFSDPFPKLGLTCVGQSGLPLLTHPIPVRSRPTKLTQMIQHITDQTRNASWGKALTVLPPVTGDSKEGVHRGSSIQPKSLSCPHGRKVNKTLTVQERLLGLPDNSMQAPPPPSSTGQAGRTRLSGNVSWKLWLNWGHKSFPE